MLILSRKENQKIIIGASIDLPVTIQVVEIRGDKVRLGIEAPKEVSVHREEIQSLVDKNRSDNEE